MQFVKMWGDHLIQNLSNKTTRYKEDMRVVFSFKIHCCNQCNCQFLPSDNFFNSFVVCVQTLDRTLGVLGLTDNSLTRSIDVTINNFLPDSCFFICMISAICVCLVCFPLDPLKVTLAVLTVCITCVPVYPLKSTFPDMCNMCNIRNVYL